MRYLLLALSLLLALPAAGYAFQDDVIVVTGSRIARERTANNQIPHVHIVRRADNYLIQLTRLSDTREEDARRAEVRTTLETVLAAAERDPAITMVLAGDNLLDLDVDMIGQVDIVEHPRREDVSTVTLYVKTPVRADDGFDDTDNRIADFVSDLETTGRTEFQVSPSYNLTLTGGADQYRNSVVEAIARDIRFLRSTFGNEYQIYIDTSFENRVSLTQTGPLELSIYLPYTAEISLRDD